MRKTALQVLSSDREASLKEAIDAFLDGKTAYLAEIRHRDLIAVARRRMLRVVKGGKV